MPKVDIYVHGNCQSGAIAKTLREVLPELEIKFREVHVIDLEHDISEYESNIKNADIILSQPISAEYRNCSKLSLAWINENRKSSSRLLTFPSLYFQGYQPSVFYLQGLQAYDIPYHDLHIVDMFLNGASSDEVAAFFGDYDALSPIFCRSEAMLSFQELCMREMKLAIDIPVSSFIGANLGSSILFHTINHPARPVIAYICNKLLRMVSADAVVSEIGLDYLEHPILAPHPSVRLGLNIRSSSNATDWHYKIKGVNFRAEEYAAAQFNYYRDHVGTDKLRSALNNSVDGKAYIQRYRSSGLTSSQKHTVTNAEVVEALYKMLLLRNPMPHETFGYAASLKRGRVASLISSFLASKEFRTSRASQFLERYFKKID